MLSIQNSRIKKCHDVAAKVHKDQVRKNGKSYFEEHVVKVVNIADNLFSGSMSEEYAEILLCSAYLHDSIEDGTQENVNETVAMLHEFNLGNAILKIVNLLTHKDEQDYEVYINKISEDYFARKVKIADILHNLHDGASDRKKKLYKEALNILWLKEINA